MTPRDESPGPSARPNIPRQPSFSKASLISPSTSAEADNEWSSAESESVSQLDLDIAMGDYGPPDGGRFDGEDSRPTSKKELWGWYAYGWAAEVFVIVGVASFLPITLEQLARENGVLLKDRTTPCRAAWQAPPPTGPSPSTIGTNLHTFKNRELPPCVVYILGAEVNTASFAMYTFSLSVLVQALLIISMSGAADHGRFRKTFLLVFAFVGSIATMLFITVVPSIYLFGAVLAIVSNTCFGASFVLLNSFLPLLVRHHPSILRGQENSLVHDSNHDYSDDPDETIANSTSSLLPSNPPDQTLPNEPIPVSPELKLSTGISSYGIGIGYIAGLLVQCLCIIVVIATGSTTLSLRLALLIAGAWWFIFTIPAALWLRPRPGPPLPSTTTTYWYSYITYAWTSLFRTISHARKLRDILIFLFAWFLLSDSIATVSGTAVLFAKTTLGMRTASLGLINVIATIFGVLGAFTWSPISSFFRLSASQTIITCIILFELIPLYGLLGFLPQVQRWGVIGLQQPWEMYPLGAIYGFVLGGLSSYCRAFFGELIPPGYEAAFYALYAITDKGSSIFGPAIVGAITDRYGEIRPAFVFLAVLIFCPLPLLMFLDVERGKKDAREMVGLIEGVDGDGDGYKNVGQENGGVLAYGTIPRIEVEREESEGA